MREFNNKTKERDTRPLYEKNKSSFRWVVLVLSCFAIFSSYYCYDNPTALATQFESKYNLSSIEFNLLYSAYAIPNIILPLFGGPLVDAIGAEYSLIIFLGLVTIGQAIFTFACNIKTYALMLVGRIIYGFGGEALCVAEAALLGVYFKGSDMALAMGLSLSLARGSSAINDYFTLFTYKRTNSIPMSLFVGLVLLLTCLVFVILMVFIDRRQSRLKEKQGYRIPLALNGDAFRIQDIKAFDRRYWLITISCVVIYGCVLAWNNIGSAFMQAKYNYSPSKANQHLLIPYSIAAVLTPILGYIINGIRYRIIMLFVAPICLLITHSLFAWTDVHPALPLVILGIAYSIYASTIWATISLVVPANKLGTAYGFITALQNGGLALFPVIVGGLTYTNSNGKKIYTHAEIFLFSLAYLGAMVGFLLLFIENRRCCVPRKESIQKNNITSKSYVHNEASISQPLLGSSVTNYTNHSAREESISLQPSQIAD